MAPAPAHWQTETFPTARQAREFKRDVEAACHLWPDGWVKGIGCARLVTAPTGRGVILERFGITYARDLTDIEPHRRQRYRHQIKRLAADLRQIVGHTVCIDDLTETHIRRWVNARIDLICGPERATALGSSWLRAAERRDPAGCLEVHRQLRTD